MARGRAARRGLHLHARSRHRLGRRGSGHPAGLAQGRLAHGPAHRPRQPPAGRAQPRPLRAGQPLRDAGVPGRRARPSPRTPWTAKPPRTGALDVLAQHIMGCACSEPFDLVALYDEVRTRRALSRPGLGGLRGAWSISSPPAATPCAPTTASPASCKGRDGLWRARNAEIVLRHRLNVGAIVSSGHARACASLAGRRARPGARSARWRRAISRCSSPATPSSSPARSGGWWA